MLKDSWSFKVNIPNPQGRYYDRIKDSFLIFLLHVNPLYYNQGSSLSMSNQILMILLYVMKLRMFLAQLTLMSLIQCLNLIPQDDIHFITNLNHVSDNFLAWFYYSFDPNWFSIFSIPPINVNIFYFHQIKSNDIMHGKRGKNHLQASLYEEEYFSIRSACKISQMNTSLSLNNRTSHALTIIFDQHTSFNNYHLINYFPSSLFDDNCWFSYDSPPHCWIPINSLKPW